MIAGRLLLLVGMLVFLVHDDEAQRVHRRENGRARADDDACAALANLVPFIMALAGGQMAVQHRDEGLQGPGTEPRFKPLHRLRRERNLRHQHDGAFALLERVGDSLQIDLSFAAAGDAVEKEGVGGVFRVPCSVFRDAGRIGRRRSLVFTEHGTRNTLPLHRRRNRRQCLLLRRIERQRLRRQNVLACIRVALGNLGGDGDPPFILQSSNRPRRRLSQFEQFMQRQLAPFFDDVPDLLLPFSEPGQLPLEGERAHEEPLAPAGLFVADGVGQDALEGDFRRATIILADPAGEFENFRRHQRLLADDFQDRLQIGVRRFLRQRRHTTHHFARPEWNLDAAPHIHLLRQVRRDGVIELFA